MTTQSGAEKRLKLMGIELPDLAQAPAGGPGHANIIALVRTGNLLFLSGTVGVGPGGERLSGKLGDAFSVDEGYQAARQAVIRLLARVRQEAGSLDRVRRVVKLLVFVNSMPDFIEQPLVANGASDLLTELFGEAGRHARSAVGVVSLPGGAPVEVEMVVEVE